MFGLHLRMQLLIAVLFAIVFAVVSMLSAAAGMSSFYFHLGLALVLMFVQYLAGPKMVEMSMGVRYISRQEHPQLYGMVEELARKARIPMPRVAISDAAIPNAFAFGRSLKDGRVCVTAALLRLLDQDELKAVIGHELSHLKNRDVLTITILSVIPMVLYRMAWQFLYFGGGRRRDSRESNTMLIGLAALVFYFITNLLVMYGSRIREYFADKGSVSLGNRPSSLASALYKLAYGSARMDRDQLKQVEGLKAFFVNDPSRALREVRDLSSLDLDRSGTIDASELLALRNKTVHPKASEMIMELMSTHPNMLKRIKQLSSYDQYA